MRCERIFVGERFPNGILRKKQCHKETVIEYNGKNYCQRCYNKLKKKEKL